MSELCSGGNWRWEWSLVEEISRTTKEEDEDAKDAEGGDVVEKLWEGKKKEINDIVVPASRQDSGNEKNSEPIKYFI